MLDDAQIENLRRLLQLADHYRLAELEVEADGLRYEIRTVALPAASPEHVETTSPFEYDGDPADDAVSAYHAVLSPMTGTFFRAEGPEGPPYVETGQHVDEGQPVGLIEAMKVFSQVPSDMTGRVVEIRVKNAELVQQGDLLMLIDPD